MTDQELGEACRAIGHPSTLITSHLRRPPLQKLSRNQNSSASLTASEYSRLWPIDYVFHLLDYRVLDEHVHKTINFYDGQINSMSIKECIRLVDSGFMTFAEIHKARISFQLYDSDDHEGISLYVTEETGGKNSKKQVISLKALSKALHTTGRKAKKSDIIDEVRRLAESPEVPSRINLTDFLRLLPITTAKDAVSSEKINIPAKSPNGASNSVPDYSENGIYVSPKKLHNNLPHHDKMVDNTKDRVLHSSLRKHIKMTMKNVTHGRAGKLPGTSLEAERVKKKDNESHLDVVVEHENISRPSAESILEQLEPQCGNAVKALRRKPRSFPPLISEYDAMRHDSKISSLMYQMETGKDDAVIPPEKLPAFLDTSPQKRAIQNENHKLDLNIGSLMIKSDAISSDDFSQAKDPRDMLDKILHPKYDTSALVRRDWKSPGTWVKN